MRRERHLNIRLTKAEAAEIAEKAKKAGIPKAEFVRRAVRGAEIREAPSADVAQLIVQIKRVGNNINGILKIANSQNLIEVPDLQRALDELGRVSKLITDAYTR